MRKLRFSVLGAGRIGQTLGHLLARQGHSPIGLTCRTLRSARQAAAFIGGGAPTTSNVRAAAGADLILIGTPDKTIAPLAADLARSSLTWSGRIVAHTSGALSSAVLEPLRRRGARVASLHPLASIAVPRSGDQRLQGTPFAIEGDPQSVRILRSLVPTIGGVPVAIPARAKALYHLIACLLSNDLVAFLSIGFEAAAGLGLSPKAAARLYLPLVRGTIENVARLGTVRALTGPVSRGDLATLRLHAEALRMLPGDLRKLHRLLALRSVTLALEAGTITRDEATRLVRQFGSMP